MYVTKRNGKRQNVSFDKITTRIESLCFSLPNVDPVKVAQKVSSGIYPGVTTIELDEFAAETSAQMTPQNPEYGILAGRIAVSNIHKETSKSFSETIFLQYKFFDTEQKSELSMIADDVYSFVQENASELDAYIIHSRDFEYSFFSIKTLEKSYLRKVNKKVVERPQHMLMRVACGIWCGNLGKVLEAYDFMSRKFYTHASPTLFNAGTRTPALSSCFLLSVKDDSVDGIFDTIKQCAKISKNAGGIGVAVSNVRARDSYIRSTNGYSSGLVDMVRVFNNTARYINQSSKRKGAFAMYLEPWHADVFEFLDLRKPQGAEEMRARDLFYGLWIPDLFMQRVQNDANWSLFCPNECPGLQDVWGDDFEALYTKYESQQKYRRQFPARVLWQAIIDSQQETGTPYLMYKDACNRKSNQKNLGTIRSSNLCVEIVEFSSSEEVACCNLASIALPKFVTTDGKNFDHVLLYKVAYMVTENLNRVIDRTFYPVKEARVSNMKHRPIAVGVQGLADVFVQMKMPYESTEAQILNKDIFETIYYACLDASCHLAEKNKEGAYTSFAGSPASKGLLQFDLWKNAATSDRWNWDNLKRRIKQHGLRNSLVTAPMPTASTAHILGNTESFEPLSNNLYVRRTMAGEFVVINDSLVRDLQKLGLWNTDMKNRIIMHAGSVQNIEEIPQSLKNIYKTVWEMQMKTLIDMAVARGAFIDQSQSFNCYMAEPNYKKLSAMHFYGWKKGLKTGMYYLRADPPSRAIAFTLEQQKKNEQKLVCSLKNKEACEACSS
eukprot:COSAG01_NODE_1716_length_9403_cov_4.038697_9_plen_779_part_00